VCVTAGLCTGTPICVSGLKWVRKYGNWALCLGAQLLCFGNCVQKQIG
jgi:hypothetical protein